MLVNKYYKWYYNIIENAQSLASLRRDLKTFHNNKAPFYYENHHIQPRFAGGSDSDANLVLLTAREHYIVHWLLTKFHENDFKYKAVSAFTSMALLKDLRTYTSVQYERLKHLRNMHGFSKKHRSNLSKAGIGKVFSEEHKKNLGNSLTGFVQCKFVMNLCNAYNTYMLSREDFYDIGLKHPCYVSTRTNNGLHFILPDGKEYYIFNVNLVSVLNDNVLKLNYNYLTHLIDTGVIYFKPFKYRHMDGLVINSLDLNNYLAPECLSFLNQEGLLYNPFNIDIYDDFNLNKCKQNYRSISKIITYLQEEEDLRLSRLEEG